MKLYTKPGTCSTGCHVALCWGGGKFDFEILDKQQMLTPEFLKLNPVGQTPVLKDGELVVSENVGVLHYIADSFPDAKLLGDGSKQQRAIALQWLAFENSDIQPTFVMILGAKQISSDQQVIDALNKAARKKLLGFYKIINAQLENREWIAGFRSVADPLLFMTLNWAKSIELDLSEFDNISHYFKRMQNDAGVRAAFKAEKIDQSS